MISDLQQIRERFAQTKALSIADTHFANAIKYLPGVYKLDNRLGKKLDILLDGCAYRGGEFVNGEFCLLFAVNDIIAFDDHRSAALSG